MKPAPFENIDFKDPKTKVRMVSTWNTDAADPKERGKTIVYDKKGKQLWSMKEFSGRRQIQTSEDGSTVVFIGNFYFGKKLHLNKDEEVAAVFEKGQKKKSVYLSDLFTEDPLKLASDRKLSVMGGNWVDTTDFITETQVDWSGKSLQFKLFDSQTKSVNF